MLRDIVGSASENMERPAPVWFQEARRGGNRPGHLVHRQADRAAAFERSSGVPVDTRNSINKEAGMVKTALFVRLEAKPGKEQEVESFLMGGLPLVEQEPATIAWFGLKIAPSVYGIFDAFPDDAGRQAHLSGKVAEALMAKAPDLFAKPPEIMNIDVLAAKLPS
jgi:quinol monooxygenase YgiN